MDCRSWSWVRKVPTEFRGIGFQPVFSADRLTLTGDGWNTDCDVCGQRACEDRIVVADGLTDEELRKAAMLTGGFNQNLRLATLKCLFERNPTDRRLLVAMVSTVRETSGVSFQLAMP